MQTYREVYESWRRDPERFWLEVAQAADWFTPPTRALDPAIGAYGAWFPDGICNTCHNAIDRHVAARGGQTAIIHDSPVTTSQRTITYAALHRAVQETAAALQAFGVGKGDRVILYMPMIPEALFAMYACARLGAIHSVVFGGFAPRELAARIDDADPKLILSASCGVEASRVVPYKPMLDEALRLCERQPRACLILQRPQLRAELHPGRDHDWVETVSTHAGAEVPCTPVAATDPLYILYTSGTTGKPKGVVRDNGGHLVALLWTMRYHYGIEPGQTMWTASDIGWVVGHSYIVYAPLFLGATTVLYEGKPVGTPDAGAFWRVIRDHGVRALFTAPTAIRAIRKEDPDARHVAAAPLPSLTHLFLAGERADPETVRWSEQALGVPVIDHWWQTETGWPVVGNPVGLAGGKLPVKYGSATVPLPGWDVQVLDDQARPVAPGTMGNLVIKLPLPPGALPTLWHADARFRETYLAPYPGYYLTSDAGYIDEDHYVFIMGRTDDVINVAGHRLSTGAMEEAIATHALVAECAVIGVADTLKGEVPLGLAVLKAGADAEPTRVAEEVVQIVRDRIGPVAALKRVVVVDRLPKTRSGKILRGTMKKIADGQSWTMPATIEDATVLDEIGQALAERGK